MLNDPKERIKERCPGCQFWGKGHVIDVVTKKDVCTAKLVARAELDLASEDVQENEYARVLPWRDCVMLYQPKGPKGLLSRIFGKTRGNRRYCIVCGCKIRPGTFGTFCGLTCATRYMDDEERKDKENEQSD